MMLNKYSNIMKITAVLIILISSIALAHDYVPSPPQDQPIMLKGGDLYTISNGILKETDLLFEDGKISQIGKNITPPDNCEIIDVSGKNVYPGLIDPNTILGLVEIGDLGVTRDVSEKAKNTADLQSSVGYNADSEIIPTVRANGITTALIVPGGSLIRGRSSLMNLDGWTREDSMEKQNIGLHISFPRMNVSTAWWISQSAEEQKKDNAENLKALYEIFDNALAYYKAKKAGKYPENDVNFEAMMPLFSKELLVFIHAWEYRQIESAIKFTQKYGLKMILVGGYDSWRLADKLIELDIPVIVTDPQSLPYRQDESYDFCYSLAGRLNEAGIKFCISAGGYTGVRNLPFQAAQTVAFGLPKDIALRSITLSTAEILGVEKDLGSLEVGKKATIVVSDGDIMDHITHDVSLEFIDGRKVDLNSKQKELYQKYRQKNISKLQ